MIREDTFTYLMGELSEVIEPTVWGYYYAEAVSSTVTQVCPQPFSPLALLAKELDAMASKLILQDPVITSKHLDLLEAIYLLPGYAPRFGNSAPESLSNSLEDRRQRWEEEGSLRTPDHLDSVLFATLYDRHHHSNAAELVRQTFLRFALLCAAIDSEPSTLRATFLWKWQASTWETVNQKVYSHNGVCLLERQTPKPASIAPTVNVGFDVATGRVERDVDSLLFQLNAMVGLDLVKAQIKLWVTRAREQESWAGAAAAFNVFPQRLIFVGNEGTGKTSVAQLIASFYKSLGILPTARVVEIDASSLMSDSVFTGEKRLIEAVQSAIGGVLLIKHSSCLSARWNSYPMDFAQALANNVHGQDRKLAVILACAPGEAMAAVVSNRSLAADFENFLHFPDFSARELAAILHQTSKQLRFELNDEAISKAEDLFAKTLSTGTARLRNAHLVNSQFKQSVLKKISRSVKRGNIAISELNTLNSVDIDQLTETGEPPACI